ncbi:MAG: carboxypeptidase-like regulatory domain-containing protein [Flavisolibacter sp.]
MKYKLLLLSIVFISMSFIAKANTKNNPDTKCSCKKNDVAGGVIHATTKKPLYNVIVTAYSSVKKEKVVITDGNGNYDFNELKPGTYKLVFEKEGFKKIVKDKVVIRPDEGCLVNIEMNENSDEFQIMPGLILTDIR